MRRKAIIIAAVSTVLVMTFAGCSERTAGIVETTALTETDSSETAAETTELEM